MDEHETKIVSEFCHQLERSKQLFNGLRDLPQYGHKQWQSYFGKTFDIYTKLWKFQQQHRLVLDHKYGLKRWQVGEIASKIGQLYYHYYLRTSETNYLHEAFSFYSAIRSRSYYSIKLGKDDGKPELLVKKLRYYARFVVVCLLLKRLKLVRELVVELGRLVEEHGAGGGQHRPDDQHEWSKVLQEIQSFLDADAVVSVQDMDSNQVVLSHRLEPRPSSATLHAGGDERPPSDALSLQEILIVGNCSSQVKFSELTIDMYRMLQTLEREPVETSAGSRNSCETPPSSATTPQNGALSSGISGARRENPHKYLLYRPTFSQLMAFLSSGFKELPNNGVMLLYLSADGCFSTPKQPGDDRYDYGGVATDSRRDQEAAQACGWSVNAKDPNCFHPGDLLPFTRKPMFIVVDSENSPVFQSIPNYFGQPLVVLTSPQYTPSPFQEDHRNKGNLLTLFLHSPLLALCLVCNLSSISVHAWEQCSRYLDVFMTEALRLLTSCRGLDSAYQRFLADDFLRLLVLRFVFCQLVLRQHRLFRGAQFQPRATPPLPETGLMAHPQLARSIRELFTLMDARQLLLPANTTDAL